MRIILVTIGIAIFLSSCRDANEIQDPIARKKAKIRWSIQEKCKENDSCYMEAAKRDFKNDKLRLFIFGIDGKDSVLMCYNDLCRYRNIEMIGTGDVGPFLFPEYNRVMIELITKKYGSGFFDECDNNYTIRYRKNRAMMFQ